MKAAIAACFIVATMMLKEASGTVTSARASSNDGNVAANAIDGKVGTRWSTLGSGEWLELTMNKEYTLTGVKISFFKGNERKADFEIQVSTDRSSWQTAVSRRSSSGSTIWNEEFDFDVARTARYVRYMGYGNSANNWNSITKISVVKGSTAAPSPSSSIGSSALVGSLISLRKTGGDKLYLTAERDGNNELIARASKVDDWEQFLVEEHPSGGVAIKAMSTGKYLQVQSTSTTTEVRARATIKSTWTQFKVQVEGTNTIALQSVFTGKWLQASWKVSSSLVYPNGAAADRWETFEWSYVSAAAPTTPTPPSSGGFVVPDGYELVSSFAELLTAFGKSNRKYRMKPGYYTATAVLDDKVTIMRTTGDNSIYDFTDATIDLPVKLLSTMSGAEHTHASWKMEGNGNTFIGGTFVNTYEDSALNTRITDYKAFNENKNNRPGGNNVYLRIWGDDAKFIGNTFIVRGSFPYGYGEIYGKGTGAYFGKKKHSGIQVVGNNALLDGVTHYQKAFGHALFVQGADGTVIRNSKFEGEMRLGADMYKDGADSLPDQSGYVQKSPDWYLDMPISKTTMYCLNEDGIRAYATGSKLDGSTGTTGAVTVEDTSVTNLRSGLALVAAKKTASVTGLHLRGCSAGFQLPTSGGKVVDSTTDAAFGPIFFVPYSNVKNGKYDVTLVNAAYSTGEHFLANIAGNNNEFIIRHDGNTPSYSRPIKVGYSWDRWELTGQDSQQVTSDISIINYTPHEMELTSFSSDCTGSSAGRIVDNGSGNSVSRM